MTVIVSTKDVLTFLKYLPNRKRDYEPIILYANKYFISIKLLNISNKLPILCTDYFQRNRNNKIA